MKAKAQKPREELRSEYDLDYSKAVRGKYYRRLIEEVAMECLRGGDPRDRKSVFLPCHMTDSERCY